MSRTSPQYLTDEVQHVTNEAQHLADEAQHLSGEVQQRLIADIQLAAGLVFRRIDDLVEIGWPWVDFEARAHAAALSTRASLAADRALTLPDLLVAIEPLIGAWWPERLPSTTAVHDAVERLRRADMMARCALMQAAVAA